MPTFEYRCRSCGNRFEYLVLSSSPPPACPACDGDDLEKLMSAPAVSSSGTQRRNLAGAKQRTDKQRFDREWESHRTAHEHHDD